MSDDVSSIPSTGCNVLNSATTLYNYSNNSRRTYIQVGGKWIYTSQSSYSTLPSGAQCIDVDSLNSRSEFYPIFIFIAFVLAVFVWVVVWKLIKPILRIRL